MPLSCCRQPFVRPPAPPPRTAGSAAAQSLTRPAMEDIMGPFLCVITILVMMSSALLAQENSAEIPTQVPRPQPQVPPFPQAAEGREGADFSKPRFVFHRSGGGFVRLDL